MSSDIVVEIISGLVTLAVGAIGGYFAYKGSIEGAIKQIEHERNLAVEKDKEQREFAINIINSFIADEIKTNFAYYKKDGLLEKLKKENAPFHDYINGKFNSVEFDKVKYELLKYSGEAVQEVNDIYKMFKVLSNKDNVNKLKPDEYQEFKRVYNICLEKYND